jgi:enoyl-CoA hydratase/carnithine racemase
MSVVEIERGDGIMIVRMNRPERLNALGAEIRAGLAAAWNEFRDSRDLEVAILTGTGRAFCAGEDMKESVEREQTGDAVAARRRWDDIYRDGLIDKPIIAAVNGFAMGGGFHLVESADFRVCVRGAVFESSEAKRWLLGGYDHGLKGALPHAAAMEMAFAFRFTAERLHELGWLNRLVEPDQLLPTARAMAAHLLTLPPASRLNTLIMMRAMRARVPDNLEGLASRLRNHGATSDLMESRKAFVEKRKANFKGWDDPQDRYRTPHLDK